MPILTSTEKRHLSQPLLCCHKGNFVSSTRAWPSQKTGVQMKLLLSSAASLWEEQYGPQKDTWSIWLFIFEQRHTGLLVYWL